MAKEAYRELGHGPKSKNKGESLLGLIYQKSPELMDKVARKWFLLENAGFKRMAAFLDAEGYWITPLQPYEGVYEPHKSLPIDAQAVEITHPNGFHKVYKTYRDDPKNGWGGMPVLLAEAIVDIYVENSEERAKDAAERGEWA